MIDDNPNVRCAVARRIGIDMLLLMIKDVSIDVRIIVAKNIDPKFFRDMINIEISYDQGISVILEILKRCNIERDAEILDKLISDENWEIKNEVEALYNVTVVDVNTIRYAGKNKSRYTRAGIINGRTNAFKKAIVTLKEGDTIDFYSNI
jgi:ribosomal protein L23